MICPNCGSLMKPVRLTNVVVDHCGSCGATFLDENEINRISLSEAHELAQDFQNETISGAEKFCPRDKTLLSTYQQESIPQHVTLLKCKECGGIFTFADDLVNFKKAQKAKINYYKAWRIPLPPLQAVLVYSFFIVTAVSILYGVNLVSKTSQLTTSAQDTITNVEIAKIANETLVCFSTKAALASELIFTNSQTGEQITRIVNLDSRQSHCASINQADIPLSQTVLYQIRLLNQKQVVLTTSPKPFVSE